MKKPSLRVVKNYDLDYCITKIDSIGAVMRKEAISQFCKSHIIKCTPSNFYYDWESYPSDKDQVSLGFTFDCCFDVTKINKDNLHETIETISSLLFNQRPTTVPYVKALLMFGGYLHINLQYEAWYHIDMLVEAITDSLEERNFEPLICITDKLKIFFHNLFEYLCTIMNYVLNTLEKIYCFYHLYVRSMIIVR